MKKIVTGLILASTILTAGCNTTASSRNLADAKVSGQDLAQQVCSICHGADGNSTNPTFPKLAGQQSAYIVGQLKEFRSHDRSDPAGYQYMWGIARHLTDKQIAELATYFSAQKNIPGPSRNPQLEAEGKQIFTHGIAAQNTPACATCHGPEGAGNGIFPRIAGQHANYIEKQLGIFKNTGQRPDGAMMKVITHNITPAQVKEVAAYLSTL
ncbi:MAG TPA: c-type cytochrome [Burkholderiales bacterium]|nr:c-type cytochrome [Burkholderiales bacterium]